MLYKCANPNCSNPFRRLDQGRLFQVETEYPSASTETRSYRPRASHPVRRVDRYWLCEQCASFLTITCEKGRGVVTVPLQSARKTLAPSVHLRELAPVTRKTLAGVTAP